MRTGRISRAPPAERGGDEVLQFAAGAFLGGRALDRRRAGAVPAPRAHLDAGPVHADVELVPLPGRTRLGLVTEQVIRGKVRGHPLESGGEVVRPGHGPTRRLRDLLGPGKGDEVLLHAHGREVAGSGRDPALRRKAGGSGEAARRREVDGRVAALRAVDRGPVAVFHGVFPQEVVAQDQDRLPPGQRRQAAGEPLHRAEERVEPLPRGGVGEMRRRLCRRLAGRHGVDAIRAEETEAAGQETLGHALEHRARAGHEGGAGAGGWAGGSAQRAPLAVPGIEWRSVFDDRRLLVRHHDLTARAALPLPTQPLEHREQVGAAGPHRVRPPDVAAGGEERDLVFGSGTCAQPLRDRRLHLVAGRRRETKVVDQEDERAAGTRGDVFVRAEERRDQRRGGAAAGFGVARLEAHDHLGPAVLEDGEVVAGQPAHGDAGLVEDHDVHRDGRDLGRERRRDLWLLEGARIGELQPGGNQDRDGGRRAHSRPVYIVDKFQREPS